MRAGTTRSLSHAVPLSLACGLLVMHALLASAHAPGHSGHSSGSGPLSADVSAPAGTDPFDFWSSPSSDAHRGALHASDTPAPHSPAGQDHPQALDPAFSQFNSAEAADQASTDPMDVLGHVCLAVLATAAILLAVLLTWPGGRDRGSSTRFGRALLGLLPRPPPTSVRLARLCVLRN